MYENQLLNKQTQRTNGQLFSISEKMRSKIAILVQNINKQKPFIRIKIHTNLYFQIRFKIIGSEICVSGSLSHLNGDPFIIPLTYTSVLSNMLKQAGMDLFPYAKCFHFLRLTVKVDLDQQKMTFQQYVAVLCNKFQVNLNSFLNILKGIGLIKILNNTSLKHKASRLLLLKKTHDIIRNKEFKRLPPAGKDFFKFENQGKNCALKLYQSMKISQSSRTLSEAPSFQLKNKRKAQFHIHRRKCQIKINSNESKTVQLAIKTRKQRTGNGAQRLSKEMQIVKQIINKYHSLNYWVKNLDQNYHEAIYMDFIDRTLDYQIKHRHNDTVVIIDLCKQVIRSVSILHESGIVHRDLKLHNLMVTEDPINPRKKLIKVIDFGESALVDDSYLKNYDSFLGFTIPYSPLQCILSQEQGYNNPEIDLWSVGLIIYELFFKKNPISAFDNMRSDICQGWTLPGQFNLYGNVRKKKGVMIIDYIFSLLTLNSVCIQQKQRISLDKMGSILLQVQKLLRAL